MLLLENSSSNDGVKTAATAKIPTERVTQSREELVWLNIVIIAVFHIAAAWILVTVRFSLTTWIYLYSYGAVASLGTTAGVHRLWSHRSFKAKWPLRVLLAVFYSATGQHSILGWVRDHRTHHKFTDTDADPTNSRRGFFYAHIGWIMQRRHSEVLRQGAKVDLSDVRADPVVQWQKRYYWPLLLTFGFIVPVLIPVYGWNETWGVAWCANIVRLVMWINFTLLVGSASHRLGPRPYDKRIFSTDTWLVSLFTIGEGWHNYHHTFPWDYKDSEYPYFFNWTTMCIDLFALVGWAYDFKSPSKEMIRKVAMRHGDGSHVSSSHAQEYAHEVTYEECEEIAKSK